MKKIHYIILIIFLSLIGIVFFQCYWLVNMYNLHQEELDKKVNLTLEEISNDYKSNFFSSFFSDSLKNPLNGVKDTNLKDDFSVSIQVNGASKAANFLEKIGKPNDAKKIFNEIGGFFSKIISGDIKLGFDKDSFDELDLNFRKKIKDLGVLNSMKTAVYKQNGKIIAGDEMLDPFSNKYKIDFFSGEIFIVKIDNIWMSIIKKMLVVLVLSLILVLVFIFGFIYIIKSLFKEKRLTEVKNDFIDNITHEFKTPLATVSAAIEGIRNFGAINDVEKTNKYLDISQNELKRLDFLVEKILNIAQYEKEKIDLKTQELNLNEIVNQVKTSTEIRIRQKGGTISSSLMSVKPICNVDKEHFSSVLYNLIDNAVKYSKENIDIMVETKDLNPHKVQVIVKDKGIGIAQEHISKIFDKFYRVPNKNIHDVKGYGLGLSYVKYIVELHNGEIKIDSKLNQGTSVIITLNKI